MQDPKLKQEIIDRTDELYRMVGGIDIGDGLSKAATLFEKIATIMRRLDTREKFSAMLDELPEPTRAERLGIRAVLRYAPHLLRYGLDRLALAVRADFPKPPGGRGRDFGPRRQVDVCRFIAELQAEDGVELHLAKKRAAARFKTSVRTIERVWASRKGKRPAEPTFQDAVRFLNE